MDYDKNMVQINEDSKWKLPFFTVVIGQSVSLVGSSAVQFALIWWISSETNSALMLGIAGFAAYLPMMLFSPFAGVLADRYNRKIICVIADLFVGASAAVFTLLMWFYEMPVWVAVLIILLRGVGNTFHSPSISAIIPQLVPQEQLVKANGWRQIMQSGSYILGPIIGAALYTAFPLSVVLLTDLAGAIIASILLILVTIPDIATIKRKKSKMTEEIKEGIKVYLNDKRLLIVVLAEALMLIFYMPLTTFLPLMISGHFHADTWYAGASSLACALGMTAMAFLYSSGLKVNNKIKSSYFGMAGMGAAITLCGILPQTMWACWIFILACGIIGGSGNAHTIPVTAYMQETIAPEKMGRAFSLLGIISAITMPLGLLIASPLAEWLGIARWFFISGVAISVITLGAIILDRKTQRPKMEKSKECSNV